MDIQTSMPGDIAPSTSEHLCIKFCVKRCKSPNGAPWNTSASLQQWGSDAVTQVRCFEWRSRFRRSRSQGHADAQAVHFQGLCSRRLPGVSTAEVMFHTECDVCSSLNFQVNITNHTCAQSQKHISHRSRCWQHNITPRTRSWLTAACATLRSFTTRTENRIYYTMLCKRQSHLYKELHLMFRH